MSLVSFPALTSHPAPANAPLRLSRSRFAGVPAYQNPQLLYHVQVVRGAPLSPASGTFPVFHAASADWAHRLADRFGMSDHTLQLIPRECSPHLEGPARCHDELSPIETDFHGRSWNLALAIGVA